MKIFLGDDQFIIEWRDISSFSPEYGRRHMVGVCINDHSWVGVHSVAQRKYWFLSS